MDNQDVTHAEAWGILPENAHQKEKVKEKDRKEEQEKVVAVANGGEKGAQERLGTKEKGKERDTKKEEKGKEEEKEAKEEAKGLREDASDAGDLTINLTARRIKPADLKNMGK